MSLKKKQGEFKFYGRVIVNDVDGALDASNITISVDQVAVDGIDLVESDLDLTAITAAVKDVYLDLKGL